MKFLCLLFLFLLPILPAGLNPATPVASKPTPAAKPNSPTRVLPSKPTSPLVFMPSKPTSPATPVASKPTPAAKPNPPSRVLPSKPTSPLVVTPSKPFLIAQPKPISKPNKPTRPEKKPIAPIPNPAGPKKPAGPIPKPVIPVEVPKPKSSPIAPSAPPIVLNGVKIMVKSEGEGWVGFGVSQTGSMVGSVAAIGIGNPVDVSRYYLGGKYVGNGGVAKVSDQNLRDTDFIQTSTLTTMKFTAPLDWNGGTLSFQNPNQTKFVLARGSSNTLDYHTWRGTLSYSLAYCLDPARASEEVCKSDDVNYDQMRTSSDGKMVIYTKLINIV